jgi:hypothetical protein
MKKTFEKYPKLGVLWSHAYRELRSAREITFIGMSLPDSDYYLKWLIRSAIVYRDDKPRVYVVNKDDREICLRVRDLTSLEPVSLGDFAAYI